jgi:hypothetical protein
VAAAGSATCRSPWRAYATLLTDDQVPAELVKVLTDVFAEVLDGHNAYLADGVQRALGRPARDFGDYVRDAAPPACRTVDNGEHPVGAPEVEAGRP